MDFFTFTTHGKSANSLLNSLKTISNSQNSLFSNLKLLDIFSRYSPEKDFIKPHKPTNSVRMKLTSKGNGKVSKTLSVNFPDIFGGGEFLSLSFHGPREMTAEVGRPVLINKERGQVKMSGGRSVREIDGREIDIKRIEAKTEITGAGSLSLGAEMIQKLNVLYGQGIFHLLGIRFESKAGVTRTEKLIPFLKILGERRIGFSVGRVFYDTGIRIGKIFGQTSLVEKFFIGEGLRGYKRESVGPMNQNRKLGGNSFIEIKNRIGMYVGRLEVFLFGDVGVSSVKGIEECARALGVFGDNNCIGKSVGMGISMKSKRGPSFIFAVPLTTNPECEKYVLGVDFEF